GNIGVADAVRTVVKEHALHRAVVQKVAMMLFAREAQGAHVELRQYPQMRGRAFERRIAKLLFLQMRHYRFTCCAKEIEWQPWQQPVPNIQSLRNDVEREGDKALDGSACCPGVFKRSRQQLTTDAAPLLAGGDEQFRQKPQIITYPTVGEADD